MGQQIESALVQSTHRVLVVLVRFLPGVLALLLAVIVFSLVGLALAALLRSLFNAVKLDERLAGTETSGSPSHLVDWLPSSSPTLLITRIALWGCVLIGIAVGLSAFDASYEANSQLSAFLLPYFTHITGAILLMLVGGLVARFLARSVLIGAVNAQMQYARFLSLGVKWLVLVLTAAMALDHLQIGGAIVNLAFGILFGGIVLTLSLAIGLGSRDLVSRSIERTIDKPGPAPAPDPYPRSETPAPAPSRLRHF